MPASKSIQAYPDCEEILNQALAVPVGLEVDCKTEQFAKVFASRCNSFRLLHRKQMTKLHGAESLQAGSSPYDTLRISRNGKILKIEKYQAGVAALTIRELPMKGPDPDKHDPALNKDESIVE